MPNVVEIAKSGRASCRGCGEKIAKDAPRFGEETPNMFAEEGGVTYRWWHLACAAKKVPNELRDALATFEGEVPDRAAIDASIAEHAHPEYPYAERAANGRAKCRVCQQAIGKNELRIGFERVYETGMGLTKTTGWLHARCTMQYKDAQELGAGPLGEKLRAHSKLGDSDFAEILAAISVTQA